MRIASAPALLTAVIGMFGLLAAPGLAYAAPELINYQGELMDSAGNPLNGTVSIVFRIYNQQSGGTILWQETHNSIQVQEGIFSVLLGSVTPFPATLFEGDSRWLGIQVESDAEMTPRSRIASVAYAVRAEKAAEAETAGYAATAGSAPADNDWGVNGANVYIPSGSVGIGTDSPSSPLHVYSSTGDMNVTIETDAGDAVLEVDGTDPYVNFQRNGADRGQVGYRTAGDYLYLYKGGWVVVKDGKLGVGEGDPQAKLDVLGDVRVSNKVIARDSAGLEFATDEGTTRVKVNDNGDVGIGTTSPGSLLHVKKPSGNYDAKIETDAGQVDLVLDGSSGNQTVEFQQNGSFLGSVGYDTTNDYLFLYEGGKAVVKDGKLGVGTDGPTETLDVEGSMKVGSSGTAFLEIRELTGTTHQSQIPTKVPYPTGYTQDNTRVLCLEIRYSEAYVGGLNMSGIRYFLAESGIWIYYESDLLDKPYRVVIMRMK